MNVRATVERMVFEVESREKPGNWYRVDLLAINGRGWCSCRDYQCRRGPKAKEGLRDRTTRCVHIEAARESFCNDFLKRLSEELE